MKTSRNAPCPCGSGKKYKKCCIGKEESTPKPKAPAPLLFETDPLMDLSNRACDLIKQSRWEEAEELCERLRRDYPDEIDADDRLCMLYKAREEWSRALEYAKAALLKAEARPDYFDQELIDDLKGDVDYILEHIPSPQEPSR